MGGMQRHLCRTGLRKSKAQLELKLAREVKGSKKGFCEYVVRRKVRSIA